jgi:hypothetical protein
VIGRYVSANLCCIAFVNSHLYDSCSGRNCRKSCQRSRSAVILRKAGAATTKLVGFHDKAQGVRGKRGATPVCFVTALLLANQIRSQPPDVRAIIAKSVQANQRDFNAAPRYNNKERDRTAEGTKLYQITMIDGTPYRRLLAINGNPLSPARQAEELRKERQAAAEREAESAEQRRARIAKYQKERTRDHNLIEQLTEAFKFEFVGEARLRGFDVYVVKATPRPGYHPPNIDCQVLPGMQGELWIDKNTSQWVKVTAQVIRPVSIEGFLAQVEPGTRFELEKAPVGGDIWQPSHFSMKSHAKVLFLVNHSSSADETYFDYVKADG